MLPNKDQISGKWKEIKGELRKTWGEITDDEFERTKGDVESISGLIQQKYGTSKESLGHKVTDIFRNFQEKREEVTADIKEKLKN